MRDERKPGIYDHVRCGTCGWPLTDHPADCPRHAYVIAALVARAVGGPQREAEPARPVMHFGTMIVHEAVGNGDGHKTEATS